MYNSIMVNNEWGVGLVMNNRGRVNFTENVLKRGRSLLGDIRVQKSEKLQNDPNIFAWLSAYSWHEL